MDYFTSEPMKYFAPSAAMNSETRKLKLEQMIDSGEYLFGEKTDGNWSRAIITTERNALQTRGISVSTKTYGEVQNKVLFWDDVLRAEWYGPTVILGEIYLPGGIDKDVGSILRCLDNKALSRQKDNPLRWRIFDILAFDGKDLMNEHFENRIKYISEALARIKSPLVEGVSYQEMDETFFDKIGDIFAAGGEGCVCYKKSSIYIPGKRGPHAWDTVKVKREIATDVDCFIYDVEPSIHNYTGKDITHWKFWEDSRTGEKKYGEFFSEYQLGSTLNPITKSYYYNWPGAIKVGVYDNDKNIYPLCSVAGLTEEFKDALRDNFQEYYLCPVTIGGMAVSEANGISIRHPYLKSIRLGDINIEDCTLNKIL